MPGAGIQTGVSLVDLTGGVWRIRNGHQAIKIVWSTPPSIYSLEYSVHLEDAHHHLTSHSAFITRFSFPK